MTADLLPIERFDPPHHDSFLDKIGRLRVEAWSQESGVSKEIKDAGRWLDAKDNGAVHYVLKDTSSAFAGSARLNIFDSKDKADYISNFSFRRPISGNIAIISRLVLLRAYHHRGLWRDFDTIRVREARAMDIDAILAICGTYRLDKLKSEGFELAGDAFEERELPGHMAFPVCHYLED
jgi:hypothetical protein